MSIKSPKLTEADALSEAASTFAETPLIDGSSDEPRKTRATSDAIVGNMSVESGFG